MPDIEVGGKALISQSGTANPVIKSNVNFTGVIDSTATGTFSGTFSGALTGATGNWGLKLLQTDHAVWKVTFHDSDICWVGTVAAMVHPGKFTCRQSPAS